MKNLGYFLVIFFLITACSVRKKPVFLKIDDVKILSYRTDTIRLQANAYFKNENDVGGKISTDEIKVIVDGAEVAQVSSEEFKVPANKEFSIPLKVVIPAKKVFENNEGGILGGLLNSVLNNSLKVQFKGDIKYKVWGYSSIYPIDKTEEIKIKF
ncbi:late embryogenesis abundant protein [Tenacibaculum adriaticum]|uniref:Late embryogenesis abundant protein n=1 Tax=Tenacibaculum adriaticum TaxID=413713 RepID=A0A5S5DT08_9FLAO|nr:LEA type 2 family protein [Tenacibaculum adriaticum]TYP99060.1 late embryogenesis abundant protein [Tenacibaculum adriaticum]